MSLGLKALLALTLIVVLTAVGVGVFGGEDAPAPSSTALSATPTPSALPTAPSQTPEEGMYVASSIGEDGLVSIETWIRSATPLTELRLTTSDPDLAPGGVESLDLLVRSMDESTYDRVLARRDSVGTNQQTVQLRTPTREIYLSYTIDGGQSQASETVAGRGLARVLGMDVDYEGDEAGLVRRMLTVPGEILSVACLKPDANFDASPRPCGGTTDDGGWLVELTGDDIHDRLLASIQF